jgi:hypothetical protein
VTGIAAGTLTSLQRAHHLCRPAGVCEGVRFVEVLPVFARIERNGHYETVPDRRKL